MKMRFWLRPLLALAAAGVCLFLLGRLTRPKYTEGILEGGLIDDYYEETGGHQVLFIGDCEVYESFTPPTLFAEYGYTSFIRGTAQQLMWQSRYILEETLAYETPRVVVLSVCSLRYGESQSESYNRMTLDYMRPSLYKWKAVVASLGEGESPVTYVLPLLRYHTRISALTAEDWKYLLKLRSSATTAILCAAIRCPIPGFRQRRRWRTMPSAPGAMESWTGSSAFAGRRG